MTVQKEKKRRVKILYDPDAESPRDAWENFGTMVCWHSKHNLGDMQPRENPHEYLTNLAIGVCPRLEDILEYWDNEGYHKLCDKYDDHAVALVEIEKHRKELVDAVLEEYFVILPLYLYDHSGITMSASPFHCPWDSGQVGYIYVSLEDAQKNWLLHEDTSWNEQVSWFDDERPTLREASRRNLLIEVEVYDQFLTGEVYGFVVEEKIERESCTCPTCTCDDWETVDSCWGFFGSDIEKNGIAEHLNDTELVEMAKNADVIYPDERHRY